MNLIDRYVAAVGRRLPRRQRADVERELRSSLYDALEARGEPADEEATVALLEEMGPPAEMAATYRPQDQYLVGPELFPSFKKVLGIVLAAYAAVLTLAYAAVLIFGEQGTGALADRLGDLLSGLLDGAVTSVGVIVVIFYALQRLGVQPEKSNGSWDPRSLPAVRDVDLVSRGEAAFGVVVPAFFLVLLNGFRELLGLPGDPVQEFLVEEILLPYLPWINAALFLGMALNTLLLVRGCWSWPTRAADVAFDLFGLAVFYRVAAELAARQGELVDQLVTAGLPEELAPLLVRFVWTIVIGAAVIVAVSTLRTCYRLWRARRAEGPQEEPAAASSR